MNYLQPTWPAPPQIKAYTTLRHFCGERESIKETKQLQSLLHLPTVPIWLKQTHSTVVVEATLQNKETIADASYTAQQNQVCAVLTADCLPILICNRQGTYVAAIHAGWRGLANGIIEATLNALRASSADWLAWLGPAIGPKKFEVGDDVYTAFTHKNLASKAAFLPHHDGKWLANLYELAKIRLNQLGIREIYGGEFCTYTQDELFFSYRRDQGKTGRMASLIWIEKK